MKHWTWLVLAALALSLLAGCGGGHENADREALLTSISGLMTGWARQDSAYLEAFISEDYAFDEQGKADHIAAIVADFPDLRNFRLVRQQVDIVSPNLASAQVEFSVQLFADVASLDQVTATFAWANSDNLLDQVWIKDFDGVWRLAAEYLKGSWVQDDTPVISSFSVQPGDQIRPGDTGPISAIGSAASTGQRVTLWPDSVAAASFSPTFSFGFGAATYSGDITTRTDALGEYSLAMIGQSDIPGNPLMAGRLLRAEYIIVSTRAGRAFLGGKVVPGNRQSIFRRLRIHRAAGKYQDPRPGTAP
jgi:hypothetical protein